MLGKKDDAMPCRLEEVFGPALHHVGDERRSEPSLRGFNLEARRILDKEKGKAAVVRMTVNPSLVSGDSKPVDEKENNGSPNSKLKSRYIWRNEVGASILPLRAGVNVGQKPISP